MKMINEVKIVSYFIMVMAMMLTGVALPTVKCEENTTITQGKNMSLLPAIEIETGENPDAAVIWLHGLGADGNDFAPIIPELQLPADLAIRFIFPHAPAIPVTINGGFVMPAWYDIREMEIDRKVDTEQLMMSAEAIKRFIDREIERGIASDRIIIAGFSQGGAVAYQVVLGHAKQLGGLLAMSTYFATHDKLAYSEINKNISIEIQHGIYDPVVPEKLGDSAAALLQQKGYQVNYRKYPMEHSVCAEQIRDISKWLQARLL